MQLPIPITFNLIFFVGREKKKEKKMAMSIHRPRHKTMLIIVIRAFIELQIAKKVDSLAF